MKKTFFTMLLATMTMGAVAQNTDNGLSANDSQCKNDTTETTSDKSQVAMVAPQFPGGEEALKKFLRKNVKYPDLAQQYDIEGMATMHFIVDTDGSIKNITATNCKLERFNTTKFSQETETRQKELKEKFALLFAKEGARVIRKMPKWIPATCDGIPVKTKYNINIRFVDVGK